MGSILYVFTGKSLSDCYILFKAAGYILYVFTDKEGLVLGVSVVSGVLLR